MFVTSIWFFSSWSVSSFLCYYVLEVGWFMVFNATFNNFSVISWWSVLLVKKSGVAGENHRPVVSNSQTLSHNVSSIPSHERGSNSQLLHGYWYWLPTNMSTTAPCTREVHLQLIRLGIWRAICCYKIILSRPIFIL